jgi:hypothetical protein
MTGYRVSIEKHDKGVGWYRVTVTSLTNFIGVTNFELLVRQEFLRQFRNQIDQALSGNPKPNPIDFLKEKD